MSISPILSLVLACCGLFAAGLCLGIWVRSSPKLEADQEDLVDDAGLFYGWDGLSAAERKRRVQARIAEQEKEWLRVRLRECAKG